MTVTMNREVQESDDELEVCGSSCDLADAKQYKKARFAWQIKGKKYGQKRASVDSKINEYPESKKMVVDESSSSSSSTTENCPSNDDNNTLEFQSTHNPKKSGADDNTIAGDAMHSSGSEKIVRFLNTSGSSSSNRNRAEVDDPVLDNMDIISEENASNSNVDNDRNSFAEATSPPINPALRLWQSKQITQGIIDNAINKVLGDMGLVNSQSDVFGIEGMAEGYINTQNIVNEGVSEAIRQQGLQRRQHSTATDSKETSETSALGVWELDQRQTGLGFVSWVEGSSSSASQPQSSSTTKSDQPPKLKMRLERPSEINVSLKYADFNLENKACISSQCKESSSITENNNDKNLEVPPMYLDNDPSRQCEDLLNTAVSCAITQKGLGMLPMPF